MRALQRIHPVNRTPPRAGSFSSVARPVGRFGFHFVEMCIVMCVGGGLLIGLSFAAAAALGFPDLRLESPELSAMVVSVILAGVMVAWMRFRRMAWRPTLEMAGSSVASGLLLVGGYWDDIVPREALVASVCLVACVAMLAVMLFRVPLYTAGHEHHPATPDRRS
jgi:hypothetical protein